MSTRLIVLLRVMTDQFLQQKHGLKSNQNYHVILKSTS